MLYGSMTWEPCPEPRCSSESMPENPENAYSYVSGKRGFTQSAQLILQVIMIMLMVGLQILQSVVKFTNSATKTTNL